jgi:Tetracyclin repressor-like, C-terminal domain
VFGESRGELLSERDDGLRDLLWVFDVGVVAGAIQHQQLRAGPSPSQLYRLMYDRSLNRSLLVPGTEDRAVAPVVRAAGEDRDLARAAWAFVHGMTILELNNRFPEDADLDAAWQRGLAALEASIPVDRRDAEPRS